MACKLAFVAMAVAAVYKGFLEKRQRGLEHPNTDRLTFQRRYFELTNEGLKYYGEKKVLSRLECMESV